MWALFYFIFYFFWLCGSGFCLSHPFDISDSSLCPKLKSGTNTIELKIMNWLLVIDELSSFAGLKNPITLMSHVTPVMAIATMILSLLLDPWSEFQKNSYFDNPWHVMRSCLLMLIGGSLAFFMVTSFTWSGTCTFVIIGYFMVFWF